MGVDKNWRARSCSECWCLWLHRLAGVVVGLNKLLCIRFCSSSKHNGSLPPLLLHILTMEFCVLLCCMFLPPDIFLIKKHHLTDGMSVQYVGQRM